VIGGALTTAEFERATDHGQLTKDLPLTASRTFPKKIKLAGENATVVIQWSDDHISSYPYRYLRGKCPCATCNELGPPPEKFVSPLPILGQKPLKPDRAELVGRYAVQIFWNDGHSSGIYSFDYLRGLCPCAVCTGNRPTVPSVQGSN
jgi:DUF971 family protein